MRNKKAILLVTLLIVSSFFFILSSQAASLGEKVKGKILLQVEENGEAWYVYPNNLQRYYLGRPADAFDIMRDLGLGISEQDFNNLNGYGKKSLSGKILLRVHENGEAYYVYPNDLKMYYLGRPADAFDIMRNLGLGITNENLAQIAVSAQSVALPSSVSIPEESAEQPIASLVENKNTLETLVIVNTDVYEIKEEDVIEVFKIAGDSWLIPQTNTEFKVVNIEYFSFNEKCLSYAGNCAVNGLLNTYFHEEKNEFPEYIVIFDNEGVAGINGGYGARYSIYWLDPSMGSFYEQNSSQKYCNKFEILNYPYDIPYAVVDYTHQYKGEGASFYNQNELNFPASIIFHELFHPYAEDDTVYEHWTSLCIYDKLGWNSEYTWDYYNTTDVKAPFVSLGEEYAGLCPYLFQQFLNSKKVCSE